MKNFTTLKEVPKIILSLVVLVTIIGSALIFKGTEYENLWLYISGGWIAILPLLDSVFKKKVQ